MQQDSPTVASPELNFVALFEGWAQRVPFQRALILPGPADSGGRPSWVHRNYGDLSKDMHATAAGLVELGLLPGDRVMMLVPAGFEFFELSLALWKLGCVPVLIDPGMGMSGFLSCVEQVRPRVLVAIGKGMVLATFKPAAFSSVELRVTVGGGTWFWGGGTHKDLKIPGAEVPSHPCQADTTAAILFTSGSTGPAKGVRYTHGMFRTQAGRIAAMYGIKPGQIDVSCFLPFAMFSMAMGVSCVLPDMDFAKPAAASPEKIVQAVQQLGAHQLVASPAVLKKLASSCPKRGVRMLSLERVLTFGAPIPRTLHAAFQKILAPGRQIHTPYGATESLPVASIGSQAILEETGALSAQGAGTCVGHIDPSVQVQIIAISDEVIESWSQREALPVGQVGEICSKGPQVSSEYFGRDQATAHAKIPDAEGFWHRMGDLGYFDEQGRLWFCGRLAHRVQLGEDTHFPVQIEGVYNEHPKVLRSAVVGADDEAVLVLELAEHQGRDALLHEVLALGADKPVCKVISRVLVHPGFPVDRRHNAKIHRPELAVWAQGRAGLRVQR